MTDQRIAPRSIAAFLLVSLIWGSTWLVIRDQIDRVPVVWSVTWRFAIAAAAMFALAAVRRQKVRLDAHGQALAALIGGFQFFGNFQFVYRAEGFITSGLVAVLFAMLMLPNALLARIWLKHPVRPAFVGGTGIALVGIALLILHEYRAAPVGAAAVLTGTLLTLCGILSASVANVVQAGGVANRYPILSLLAWAMLWGTLGNAALAFALEGTPVFSATPGYVGGLLYLALMGSVVTFPLYFGLIRDIGPGRAAYSGVVTPVIAMLLSTLFEGYRWTWLAGAGGALALAGLLVAMQARRPAR